MAHKRTAASICLLAAFLTAPALAGSPNNPGAAGQIVSGLAQGPNFGQDTADLAKAGNVPGRNLQGFAAAAGGAPNPANDKGSGND
jgi:hypothetical protein